MAGFKPKTITEDERLVVRCAGLGDWAEFADTGAGRPVVRAAFLRRLMLGLKASGERWKVAPPGVRVRGARIEGALDLADCVGLPALSLEDCDIPDEIDLSCSRLARVSLRGSRISVVLARDAVIGGPFDVSGACPWPQATDAEPVAWIDAAGCTVEGDVVARGVLLRAPAKRAGVVPGDERYALRLRDAEVHGRIDLTGGSKAFGGVLFGGAHVRGNVLARGLKVTAGEGHAVSAQAARLDGVVLLDDGFSADGVVWLSGVRIGESLQCDSARLSNRSDTCSGAALVAGLAEIGGAFLLRDVRAEGRISLAGAKLGGNLECDRARLLNRTTNGLSDALVADGAEIGGAVFLRDGFTAEGRISLLGATLGGGLDCKGARLSNPTKDGSGGALVAANAVVGGDVLLCNRFNAHGRISFLGAKVAGTFDCTDAHLFNQTDDGAGVALAADNIEVGGDVMLRGGFVCLGRVSLYSARLRRSLDCTWATFINPADTAINAENAQVDGTVFLEGAAALGDFQFGHATVGEARSGASSNFPAPYVMATLSTATPVFVRRDWTRGSIGSGCPCAMSASVPRCSPGR